MDFKKLDIIGVDIKQSASQHWEDTRAKRYRNYFLFTLAGVLIGLIGGA